MSVWLVVDSSMLQAPELSRHLRADSGNMAVLTDFAQFELFKQQTPEALSLAASVLGQHPRQIAVLRSGGEIARLGPITAVGRTAMIDHDSELAHRLAGLRRFGRSSPVGLEPFVAHWLSAASLAPSLIEGAEDIALSLPEMEEQLFDSVELRIVRTGGERTAGMREKSLGAVIQIWEGLSDLYGLRHGQFSLLEASQTFLFRFALGIYLHFERWVRNGSQPITRMDRLRNDLVDLGLGLYASYFDGLLTADVKAAEQYRELESTLAAFQELLAKRR